MPHTIIRKRASQTCRNDFVLLEFHPLGPITFGKCGRVISLPFYAINVCRDPTGSKLPRPEKVSNVNAINWPGGRRKVVCMISGPGHYFGVCAQWAAFRGMNGAPSFHHLYHLFFFFINHGAVSTLCNHDPMQLGHIPMHPIMTSCFCPISPWLFSPVHSLQWILSPKSGSTNSRTMYSAKSEIPWVSLRWSFSHS